jgi:hypothetical protein
MNLLEKDVIIEYQLPFYSCAYNGGGYTESRLQFFVDWDATLLFRPCDRSRNIPLHHVAECMSIELFRSLFVAGINYNPEKRGISLIFCINTTMLVKVLEQRR